MGADTYLLDALPDRHRASAYATYSASMMLVQSTGSTVVGSLTAAGVGFGAVFGGLAAGVLVLAAALGAGFLAGIVPRGDARPGA